MGAKIVSKSFQNQPQINPKINPKLVQNHSKINPKSLQNGTLARESIFIDFSLHFGSLFGPILDQFSIQKWPQKHIENHMQKCLEKCMPLDVSGVPFWTHFWSKCHVFSERFSSIHFERAFYMFRPFFELLDPQKTMYFCSKTRVSSMSTYLA